MLPVGYLASSWSFLLSDHHGSIPKTGTQTIFICPIHMFMTAQKSAAARTRSLQTMLPLFKPALLPVLGMTSPQHSSDNPHQIQFDSNSQKFLIDSGASVHMWAQCKDFISYHILTKDKQERDQVLGVSSTMIKPLGIRSVKVLVEDDQSNVHTLHLHEVPHLPSLPINIFVP